MRITGGAISEVALVDAGVQADIVATPADALAHANTLRSLSLLMGEAPDGAGDILKTLGNTAPTLGILGTAPLKNPTVQADEALNDSNKTITVPADTMWHILSISVELTTTSTAGTRVLQIRFQDASNDILLFLQPEIDHTASLQRIYEFAPGYQRETSFTDIFVYHPLPSNLWLPAGFVVNIEEKNAVAAAADDMIVQMLVDERT